MIMLTTIVLSIIWGVNLKIGAHLDVLKRGQHLRKNIFYFDGSNNVDHTVIDN